MADPKQDERPSDDWGNAVAKWTFWFTLGLAVLFVGYVFITILH